MARGEFDESQRRSNGEAAPIVLSDESSQRGVIISPSDSDPDESVGIPNSAEAAELVTEAPELEMDTGPIQCGSDTSVHMENVYLCSCSDDENGGLVIQFADGPLLCHTCFGRIVEYSTPGESEASNSPPSMDTSTSGEESFPGTY